MKRLIVILVALVVAPSTLAQQRGNQQTKSRVPAACVFVLDSAGVEMGLFVGFTDRYSSEGHAVLLTPDRRTAGFLFDRTELIGGFSANENYVLWRSNDCTGTPYLLPVGLPTPVPRTAFNGLAKTLYIEQAGSTTQVLDFNSYSAGFDGVCYQVTQTHEGVPAESTGLDFGSFLPPFTVAIRPCR